MRGIRPTEPFTVATRSVRFTRLRPLGSLTFNPRHHHPRHFRIKPTNAIAANNKIRGIENMPLDEIQHRTIDLRPLQLDQVEQKAASTSRLSSSSVWLHRRSARRCSSDALRVQTAPTASLKRRSSPRSPVSAPRHPSPRLRLWMVLRLSPLLRRWLRRRPRLIQMRH